MYAGIYLSCAENVTQPTEDPERVAYRVGKPKELLARLPDEARGLARWRRNVCAKETLNARGLFVEDFSIDRPRLKIPQACSV